MTEGKEAMQAEGAKTLKELSEAWWYGDRTASVISRVSGAEVLGTNEHGTVAD